jgi:protein-tyrosine phosphatase
VLCAGEIQPPDVHFPGVEVLRARLDDSGPPPTQKECLEAAKAGLAVAEALNRDQRVLVTCAQGRNRSALVAGLALHERYGMSGAQAVHHLRMARSAVPVLTNPHFVCALFRLPRQDRA